MEEGPNFEMIINPTILLQTSGPICRSMYYKVMIDVPPDLRAM